MKTYVTLILLVLFAGCKGCIKDFDKEPAKYIKKIEEAEAKAKKAKS